MAKGNVRNKTQVMASPETDEITMNRGGDSAELQSFDRWLSDRFPAARMAWIRWSSLKLQIGTNLDRNGGRKWENRPGRACGSGWIRFGFSSLSLSLSLSAFNMSRQRPKRTALPPAQENIDKLEKIVNEGNFYGAQQMYKSISARYVAAQRYSEALDLLHAGACLQLKNNQLTCGAELAVSFVEALVKGKVAYDNENLDRVRKIYELFPQIPVPHNLEDDDDLHELTEALGAAKLRVEGCSSFLKAAIKWSIEFGAPKTGSPELHVMLAEYLYSESPELDMARVSFHFVRGNNPEKFASTIVNFMGKCYPGEDDLAVARAILMYLSLGNMKDANYIMDEVKKQVENKQLQLQPSDLIQFVFYVLQTLERDALPLFNMLRANYKASIEREPAFNEMLDDIAEKFFGVKRRNPMQGIFGDIFKMM